MAAESSPKIAIVDENPIRAAILEEGLREAGFTAVEHVGEMNNLLARIYQIDPDVWFALRERFSSTNRS